MQPSPSPDAPTWLSAHLFYDEAQGTKARGDRVVLEVLEPFVRRCAEQGHIQRHFFIRFNKLGQHARLRLLGEAAVLERSVKPALEALLRLTQPPREDESGLLFPAEHELITHVRWLPYAAELERYGGLPGVQVAEEFFFRSSEAAFALMHQFPPGDVNTRYAKALLAMTVLLHAMCEDREHATRLARIHSDYALDIFRAMTHRPDAPEPSPQRWNEILQAGTDKQVPVLTRPVHSLWEAMRQGLELPEPLQSYHRDLEPIRRRLETLRTTGALTADGSVQSWRELTRALMPSYIHMMNNRLGVYPLEEAFLGFLLARILIE